MTIQKTFEQMSRYFNDMIIQKSTMGSLLWSEFLAMHPADAAQFFNYIDKDRVQDLFTTMPFEKRVAIFTKLSDTLKLHILSLLAEKERGQLLARLSIDELTDVFDDLSDDALRDYLKLLHKKDRQKVVSLLKFDPESAGGIMDTDVLTLMADFTIEKSIKILQRLQPEKAFYQTIFVTDQDNRLEGYIKLEDLVLKNPKFRLFDIVHTDNVTIPAQEDRQEVVNIMTHYDVSIAPVIDKEGFFLGVITSDTLVDVVEQEASEDIYRMATVSPMEGSYLETPFVKILIQRGSWLVFLLLAQSISGMVLAYYEATLAFFYLRFISMLTSTGGNASSQTSAIIIQGLATGQITSANVKKFLWREISMAAILSFVLGVVAFMRAYTASSHNLLGCLAISISLCAIVMVSIVLGSCMPLILKKLKVDPAHAAGPLLATLMDIIGITLYCVITHYIIS